MLQTPGANPRVMSAASALLVRSLHLHCLNSTTSAAISENRGFAARSTQLFVHYFSNNKEPALHLDKSKFRSKLNCLGGGLAESGLRLEIPIETPVSRLSFAAQKTLNRSLEKLEELESEKFFPWW